MPGLGDDRREAVRRAREARRATLERLRRVNAALSAWDEHEAALLRPDLFPTPPGPPSLGRDALKDLRRMLVAALAEQEAAWERRH